jgi:hypothetical protein
MAKITESVIGVLKGKIGQVVGFTWKGIPVLRVLPGSIANPQTDKQLAQRQKWSVTMHFLKPISEFLKTGFKSYAVKMTGINAAMGYNIKNALTGTYPNIAIDYPNALVSRGNLAGALNQVAASTVAGTVHFTWDDNSGEIGASTNDKTLLVIYNPSQNQAVTVNELAERGDETQTVTVPDSFSGDLVQCYMAFINEAGEVSNSAFAGAVTVA